MEIVSSDEHDVFDEVEGDFDEDHNHVATFIASEHVSLTEELLAKHKSALKVRKKKPTFFSLFKSFQSLNLILHQLGCECDNDQSQDLLSTISTLEAAVQKLLLKENEKNLGDLEEENDLLDTDNITDEKQILEVKIHQLFNNYSLRIHVGQTEKFRNLVGKMSEKV